MSKQASSLGKFVAFSAALGVVLFIISLLWRVWILIEFGSDAASARSLVPPLNLPFGGEWVRLAMAGFVSPLVETFGFIFVLLSVIVVFRLLPDIGIAAIYVVTCGVAGWYLHGANLATIGQALCFSALAAFTFLVYSRFGLLAASGLNLLAHMTWNFGGVALYLLAMLR